MGAIQEQFASLSLPRRYFSNSVLADAISKCSLPECPARTRNCSEEFFKRTVLYIYTFFILQPILRA